MPNLKEALFYEKQGEGKVHCLLCPRDCKIKNGNVGYCGVRKNVDGKLYSLIYNVVSSIANDPIEKNRAGLYLKPLKLSYRCVLTHL